MMIKYAIKTVLEFIFSSRGSYPAIQEEIQKQRLEEAKKILYGERPNQSIKRVLGREKRTLARYSWSPPLGTKVIGLVYICHGFTEHMANYNGVAEFLSRAGYYCFGTDLVGHGLSESVEDHLKAFIPDFGACRLDILDHIK